MTEFQPVQGFDDFPLLQAGPADTRVSTFVPDGSITTEKVSELSVTKLRMIGAKVYRTTTQSITDITPTPISFDAEEYDEGDLWLSGSATRLTLPYSGVYQITGLADFANGAGTDRRIYIYSNGSEIMRMKYPIIGALTTECIISYNGRFTAGDYLELYVRQNSGGNLNVNSGVTNNFFSAVFQGPI